MPVDAVEHVDKWELSRIIGVPPRAIVRWIRQAGGIPHTGAGHQVMLPKQAALEWIRENYAGLYGRRFGGEA